MTDPIGAAGPSPLARSPDQRLENLKAQAEALEASFLAEMLGHAGLVRTPSDLGGGAGEDQFGSFLREAHAKAIVDRGGIGLAEHLFNALKVRLDPPG